MKTVSYLLARFSEPSSYAGLSAMLALTGLQVPDAMLAAIVNAAAAGCALVAVILKDRGLAK